MLVYYYSFIYKDYRVLNYSFTSHLQLVNSYSCMSKMSFSTAFISTYYVNAPSQKGIKALVWIFFVILLVPFNEGF